MASEDEHPRSCEHGLGFGVTKKHAKRCVGLSISSGECWAETFADFPSETFVDQLHQLIICLLERQVAGKKEHYPSVLKAELAAAACQVETTASSRADSLRKIFSLRTHRSPKRRSFDFEESETSRSATLVVAQSPCLT